MRDIYKLVVPLTAVSILSLASSSSALANEVEVPSEGPCCYATPGWESPEEMPLVDQDGNAYVYDPGTTLMAGTCHSGLAADGFVFGVTDISDQSNAVFGLLRRTDTRHTTFALAQLVALLLLLQKLFLIDLTAYED